MRILPRSLAVVMVTLMLGISVAQAELSIHQSKDGVLAQVNDEVILKSEFIDAVQALAQEHRANNSRVSQEVLQQQAMDMLITRKLQLGIIKQAGYAPNEQLVNGELVRIAQSQGLKSLGELQQALDAKQRGSYATLRSRVTTEIALAALWQAQVRPRIRLSEQEIDAFLSSPEGAKIPHERHMLKEWQASHILAKVDGSQMSSHAEQKINAIYTQLQKGADFRALAATYSDDTGSATQNGSLGWVGEGQMVAEFEEMMKNTEKGDFSTPFRSQFGWHIVKVDDVRERDISAQMRREAAREILFNRMAPQAEDDWVDELRAAAYIKIFE